VQSKPIVPSIEPSKNYKTAESNRLDSFMRFMTDIEEEMSSRYEQSSQRQRLPTEPNDRSQVDEPSMIESEQ